jgi:hypothetical protein
MNLRIALSLLVCTALSLAGALVLLAVILDVVSVPSPYEIAKARRSGHSVTTHFAER